DLPVYRHQIEAIEIAGVIADQPDPVEDALNQTQAGDATQEHGERKIERIRDGDGPGCKSSGHSTSSRSPSGAKYASAAASLTASRAGGFQTGVEPLSTSAARMPS